MLGGEKERKGWLGGEGGGVRGEEGGKGRRGESARGDASDHHQRKE